MVETIFDTLNAKAAHLRDHGSFSRNPAQTVPLIISGTVTDRSGRILERTNGGSISHLDRARGAARGRIELRARTGRDGAVRRRAGARRPCLHERLSERRSARSAFADRFSGNAGKSGAAAREMGANGWLNIVGGCCGTTPDHIRGCRAVRDCRARLVAAARSVGRRER